MAAERDAQRAADRAHFDAAVASIRADFNLTEVQLRDEVNIHRSEAHAAVHEAQQEHAARQDLSEALRQVRARNELVHDELMKAQRAAADSQELYRTEEVQAEAARAARHT